MFFIQVSETFAGSDLHYRIPFWIGVIVISLLFLSSIIASIRYCFYTLCASHTGKLQIHFTHFSLSLSYIIENQISIQTFHCYTNQKERRKKRENNFYFALTLLWCPFLLFSWINTAFHFSHIYTYKVFLYVCSAYIHWYGLIKFKIEIRPTMMICDHWNGIHAYMT